MAASSSFVPLVLTQAAQAVKSALKGKLHGIITSASVCQCDGASRVVSCPSSCSLMHCYSETSQHELYAAYT
eukprot:4978197-Amphidinium_carterae.1